MKNKKSLLAIAGLVGVLTLGGTFAYFTNTTVVENPFKTASYSTSVEETFTPDTNWKPGTTTTKEVLVTNTGSAPIVARVKYQDAWKLKGKTIFTDVTDEDSQTIKNLTENTLWVDGGDGYYYYTSVINKGNSSNNFLDSVTLKPETSMGEYINTTYYKETETSEWGTIEPKTYVAKKVDSTLNLEKPGYADAEYKLTITVETTQADKAAAGVWVTNNLTNQAVKDFFATLPGTVVIQ